MKNIILILLFILTSCASYEHVRPGADGVHKVVIRGKEKSSIEIAAMSEAKDFCGEKKQSAAFVSENTKYTGSMDESTYNTIKSVSKAATEGGEMMEALGGKKERNVGKGIFGVGVVGGVMEDEEAYTTDMSFKCI